MESTNDTETKMLALLINEESEDIEVPGYGCSLRFKRPSMTQKHRGRSWAYRKMREYGYDANEDNDGTSALQYWGQLNTFVTNITLLDGKKPVEYTFDPKVDTDYGSVFEKFVIEEIYNRRGLQEDNFIAQAVVLLIKWIDDTAVVEGELKNS